jgi:hypothetical protein
MLGVAFATNRQAISPGTETDWLGRFDSGTEGYGTLGGEGDMGVRQEELAPLSGASMGLQQHPGMLAANVDPNTATGGILAPPKQNTGLLSPSRASVMDAPNFMRPRDAMGSGRWGSMGPSQQLAFMQMLTQPRRF